MVLTRNCILTLKYRRFIVLSTLKFYFLIGLTDPKNECSLSKSKEEQQNSVKKLQPSWRILENVARNFFLHKYSRTLMDVFCILHLLTVIQTILIEFLNSLQRHLFSNAI